MGTYVPNTRAEQQQMLEACGFTSFEDMYSCIPEKLRLKSRCSCRKGRRNWKSCVQRKRLHEKTAFILPFSGAPAHTGISFHPS